ncbi:restriction endonuclease subunit S [Chryseobacterium suipulveris]|uniref:Restriction endonuclease subunit S n=1 Tax=Chryseobacterium suipulveris TaxID=2929800 RepID=A0ABY4BU05_9FLAO|nr:restriction endonuclease subunit S [Chryseobacterium suipulveris]UOE41186.1 restriction endonuclease subunit S [Chryseobacterium suipulveris]
MEKKSLPKHWEVNKLKEISEWGSGGTPKSTNRDYYEGGDIPWLIIGDLNDNFISSSKTKITELGLKNSSAKIVPSGNILIALYGSIGKLGINKIPLATNQAIAFTKNLKEFMFNKYLFYFLFYKRAYLNSLGKGATQMNISQTVLKEVEIPIPPLPEQQAIVQKIEELFSELDNSIQNLKTAQKQIKIYRQSVLKSAFEGKLTQEKLENIQQVAEPKLEYGENRLPEGWKWVKLGDVVKNVEYGSSEKSKKFGKIPVLRMGNIQNGKFDWEDLVYTDTDSEIEKYLLKKNDVLFNRTNSSELVGKTAIYKGERPAIFAGYLIRINYDIQILNPKYLTFYLNSASAREYGDSVKTFGVNQSNINGTKLKTYPLPLAPLSVQEEIVSEIESRFSVADKLEEAINQSLEQAEVLRQSILKKAFEGKLL